MSKTLTAAEAAACVKRVVPDHAANGKPRSHEVAVEPNEVLDWAERQDGTMCVVTIDGCKLFGAMPAGQK